MTEHELIQIYSKARLHIIISQIAPTALLGFAALVTPTIAGYSDLLRLGFVLILLASGILGALVQFSASREAKAIAADLKSLPTQTGVSKTIISHSKLFLISMFITPVIFIGIFISLVLSLA